MNNYQTRAGRAGSKGRTTPKKAKTDAAQAAREATLVLPDRVSVAIGELAGELEEGLLSASRRWRSGSGSAGPLLRAWRTSPVPWRVRLRR